MIFHLINSCYLHSLKLTKSWNIRHPKRNFIFQLFIFRGKQFVSGMVNIICLQPQNLPVFFGTSLATAKHPKGLGGHQTRKRRKGIEGVGIWHHMKIYETSINMYGGIMKKVSIDGPNPGFLILRVYTSCIH